MPTLHWLTRNEDIRTAGKAPYRLLEAVPEHSAGSNSENMLIHGDNLEALKALLPYYAGKVKCIYIDPPYNTRSAFTHYDDSLEHSIWLAMIYPRLELLRELLAEDGSIWISIDDNEGHYLKVIMDEVFGRKNFVSSISWEMIYTKKNTAKHFSTMHDYILVYSKNIDDVSLNLLPRTEEHNKNFKNPDNDPRGPWIDSAVHARNYYSKGSYSVISPSGKTFNPPPGRYWTVSKENFEKLNAEGFIWWGTRGDNAPRKKTFIDKVRQGVIPGTIWSYEEAGHNAESKDEIKKIFMDSGDIFITPKPEKLLKQILTIGSNSGDIVLDSCLGSGTTAAVAHKMGRHYIGIEMGDHAVTHCAPRLKKVIEGEQGGISQAVNWQGGGGFRFYKLGEPVFDENGQINPKVRFKALAAHVWFSETGIPYEGKANKPFLGVHDGVAYGLLYNGILGDKRVNGGNVLTRPVLKQLDKESGGFEGPWVIYGEMSRISEGSLRAEKITFKQTPYDVRAR